MDSMGFECSRAGSSGLEQGSSVFEWARMGSSRFAHGLSGFAWVRVGSRRIRVGSSRVRVSPSRVRVGSRGFERVRSSGLEWPKKAMSCTHFAPELR